MSVREWQPQDGRCAGAQRDPELGEVCCGGPNRLVCGVGREEPRDRLADRYGPEMAALIDEAIRATIDMLHGASWWRRLLRLPKPPAGDGDTR